MRHFILGAIAIACWVAGLFFLRFWRATRDRLFAIFAAAFWLLGLIRIAQALLGYGPERTTSLYWVRLLAFGLILVAILDKNRSRKPPSGRSLPRV